MSVPPARITRIDWLRVLPVLHLRDALRAAFSAQALVPVIVAVLLAGFGQRWIDRIPGAQPAGYLQAVVQTDKKSGLSAKAVAETAIPDALHRPSLIFWQWLTCRRSIDMHWLATMLWQLMVWGFFGLAVCRSSAESACHDRRTGVTGSCRFALQHWKAVPGIMAIVALLMLFSRIPFSVAAAVAGTGEGQWTWVVPLRDLLLLVSLVFAVVLAIAAPLSIAAVGVDRCAPADAVSRCVSYVLSHKLRTLVYVFVLALGIAFLRAAVDAALAIGAASAMNLEQAAGGVRDIRYPPAVLSLPGIRQWLPGIIVMVFFWAGISVVYRLLRHTEDSIRMDEMHEEVRRVTRSKPRA